MKGKLIFIFSILLILTGCGKKYTITPDSLPVAYVNQEYKQTIKISGGKVVDHYAKLETDIPEDLGIIVQPANDLDGYNIIEVKGNPKYKGTFTIHIWVGFYAGGDAEINKTYTLTVQ
nr:membrane lipoprotein lipid attachment site-containing protein [Acinetobacter sp. Marseille-Q1620]